VRVLVAALALLLLAAPARAELVPQPTGTLQALDKITARVSSLTMKVGEPQQFGRLTIALRACWRAPPIEPPESAAYVEIDRAPLDPQESGPERIFAGWMFASSRGLRTLEDPIYDVWVVECGHAEPPLEITPEAVPEKEKEKEAKPEPEPSHD